MTINIIFICLSFFITNVLVCQSINTSFEGVHIRIYDNIAEISKPITISNLPITYSQQEWSDIRSDSFRLIGNCVNVRSQTISFTNPSLNGEKILIKRHTNNETFTDGIMIDETRNLIQDLTDNTYYTVSNDRIRYFSIPQIRNYSINFVVESFTNEQLYIRYLQKNIKWDVQYDLLLENNDTNAILQAYASIRNVGNSKLIINCAELISGDITIQSPMSVYPIFAQNDAFSNGNLVSAVAADSSSPTARPPSISHAEELFGVYLFKINETFTLDPRSTHILPMFRPIISIERYGLIEKYFSNTDNQGSARRAYRLRVEDTILPEGQVFIRESDRLIGETSWKDTAVNDTNEFTLGQDSDLQYVEYIHLDSRQYINESNSLPRILSTYTIDLHLINNKQQRSIKFEYRLQFYSQENLKLIENTMTNNLFQIDGASILGLFEINENSEEQFQFTFQVE